MSVDLSALSCAARGWAVLPLYTIRNGRCTCPNPAKCKPGKHPHGRLAPHGLKDATCDPEQLQRWWSQVPDANLGVVTGAVSGLVVLDVDVDRGGEDTLHELELQNGELPHSVEVVTGSGGRHVYFAHPGSPVPNSAGTRLGPGLDIRGDGGYVVAPPSIHVSGRRYEWEVSHRPDDTPLASMPAWLLTLAIGAAALGGSGQGPVTPTGLPLSRQALGFVAQGAPVGQQRDAAIRAGRSFLGAGYSVQETADAIWRGLRASPCGNSAHPWTEQDARDIADDLASKPAPPPAPLRNQYQQQQSGPASSAVLTSLDSPLRRTDTGNAEYFAHLYGSVMRYDYARSRWLKWCTHWWIEDSDAEVRRLAEQAARKLCTDAASIPDADTAKRVFGWGLRSLQRGGLDATISLAQAQRPIADSGASWDMDPWLLGVNNGVVDLQTGQLREGQQQDRITKHAEADFDPVAQCPLWLVFLNEIMDGNQNLIEFLQRAVGYSLTGIVSERVLFILHGSGANGKSTLLDTIRALLGGYALRTPTETLMMKQQTTIPNDIARLRGARFVFASETEGGKRLAEALIKDMTGDDVISARFMRSEFFDFKPEFKIWMGTNHKPEIRGTDNGIWDRLKLIPFIVRIPEKRRDKHLAEKLHGELSGILNWAIAGCLEWQRSGLGVPDEVIRATAGYREEQDALAGFIGGHCIVKLGTKVGSTALYKAYVKWCEDGNEKPEKQRSFSMRLKERGLENKRTGHGGIIEWHGIGLLVDPLANEGLNEGLKDHEAVFGLPPRDDITAGVNGGIGSQSFNPSIASVKQADLPAFDDDPQGIQIATARKTVDKAKLQDLLDRQYSMADAIDLATIRSDSEPYYEPDELVYERIDDEP